MATRIEFGYSATTGSRGVERVNPATYVQDLQEVLDVACQVFSSFWVSDHLMMGDKYRCECWTQLTWIAARYPSQTIGANVLANSFRHPPLVAKMAATLQTFSRGRLVLGYGSGFLADEYHGYGYDYPSAATRIAQMVEGVEVIRALWTQAPANYQGKYYRVKDAYCVPRPEPLPPIMIAGDGEELLLRAVARHADHWLAGRKLEVLPHKLNVLRQHCESIGRDFETIKKHFLLIVYLAKTKQVAEEWATPIREAGIPYWAGEPAAFRDYIAETAELGINSFQLVFPDFPETRDIQLFADQVLPAFR